MRTQLSTNITQQQTNENHALVNIYQQDVGGATIPVVNARELHSFLEVGRDFSNWIKSRISQYDFVERVDYITLAKTGELEITGKIEYHITLDMAKELSMVERNERGKQARRYFIECERRVKNSDPMQMLNDPAALRHILIGYTERVEKLEHKVIEDAPKVEFYDHVMGSEDTIDMGSVAKVLNIPGMGRNNLFAFLRDKKVLDRNNAPYQRYIDLEWFRQVESKYQTSDGETHIRLKTVVFQKGVDGIRKLIEKSRGGAE